MNWMGSFSHLHVFKGSGKHNRQLCFNSPSCSLISPWEVLPWPSGAAFQGSHEHCQPGQSCFLEVWTLPGEFLRAVPLLLILYTAKSCGSPGRIPSRVKDMASLGRISLLANYCCFLHCISILATFSFLLSEFYAVFDIRRADKCYWRNTFTSNLVFVAKWTCRLALEDKNGIFLPCQSLWHILWQILPNDL